MAAPYDKYNYFAYWQGRTYEHECEVIAIKSLINEIPQIKKIAEIGSGFGRLTPYYSYRARKTVLIDPSGKLLRLAKTRLQFKSEIVSKNVKFVKSTLENLPNKFSRSSFDLIIVVRVFHHIKNLDKALSIIEKLLSKKGYFILEFPNKIHWKALLSNFLKGNFTFPLDIFPSDKNLKNGKDSAYPFLNYHPDILKEKIARMGFEIKEMRSVSNIRNPFLKKHLPVSYLLSLEKKLQKPLSRFYFGPSIFVLAQKIS